MEGLILEIDYKKEGGNPKGREHGGEMRLDSFGADGTKNWQRERQPFNPA
jgi:hypothetical protein